MIPGRMKGWPGLRHGLLLPAAAIVLVAQLAGAADDSVRDRSMWLCRQAEADLRAARVSRAGERFAEAARMDPTCPEAEAGLGRVARLRGLCEEAVIHLRAAVGLFRNDVARRTGEQVEQARLIEERNQAFKAVGWEDHMLHPKNRVESMDSAVILDGSGDDVLPGLFFQMGVCLLRLGRPAEAHDAFVAELGPSPDSSAVRVNLAVCELSLDNPGQALTLLDQAVSLGAAEPEGLRAEIESALSEKEPGSPPPGHDR